MHSDFPVVLDACVLASPTLCDLFLRLAETPRLYSPIWSVEILEEVFRTQTSKFKKPYPESLAHYWREEVTKAFPEACILGWEVLLPAMTNDAKDRHVTAAAVKAGASVIVTFNLKHFRPASLRPLGIEAVHPQDYLLMLWGMNPSVVIAKIGAMAVENETELQDVLLRLGRTVPRFSAQLLREMGLGEDALEAGS